MQLYSKETLDYEMRNEDQTRGKETSAIIDSVNRFFSTHPT
jgi:hypothetical protein